jgi:hypothetical protein
MVPLTDCLAFLLLLISFPDFIRLRQNTLQLAAGMNGVATRRSSKSEGGLASANSVLIPRSLLRGASFKWPGSYRLNRRNSTTGLTGIQRRQTTIKEKISSKYNLLGCFAACNPRSGAG